MRRKTNTALACALAFLCVTSAVRAATKPRGSSQSYVGVQGLLIAGEHHDVTGTQRGIGGAPLLQLRIAHWRIAFALEGIPALSAPQRASAFYGQATPAVGIVNGSFQTAVDPHSRIWVGVGSTIINQRTPLPNIQRVVSS